MLDTTVPTDSPGHVRSTIDATTDSLRALGTDTRAIEGLPIRLVIALVVGVASLSVMMNMLTGIQGLAVTELDARPDPDVITPGEQTIDVTVLTPDGATVSDATIIVKGASASTDGIETAKTDADGTASVTIDPGLRPNQDEGTVTIDVKPPAGSGFVDRRGNTEILVIRE